MSNIDPVRVAFEEWLSKQDLLLIPELGYESVECDMSYLAYIKGREDMHKDVLTEWIRVYQPDQKRLIERIEELK